MTTTNPVQERYIERTNRRQIVVRSDGFEMGVLFGYLNSDMRDTIHESVNGRHFPVGSTDASSRVLNSWEAEGVIDDPRTDAQGWRRYSLLEVVWLHTAIRLRRFGLPVQALIRVRHTMNELWVPVSVESGPPITLFEMYVLHAMAGKRVYLLAFEDGTAELATDTQCEVTSSLFGLADHIRIELNLIISNVFPKLDLPETVTEHRVALSSEETSILSTLRRGDFTSVTFTMQNGKVRTIQATEDVKGDRIVDILRGADFQDIEVKQRDGKIVKMTRTLIKKL